MEKVRSLSVHERIVVVVERFANLSGRFDKEILESATDLLARISIAGKDGALVESRLQNLENILDTVDPKFKLLDGLRYDEAAGM